MFLFLLGLVFQSARQVASRRKAAKPKTRTRQQQRRRRRWRRQRRQHGPFVARQRRFAERHAVKRKHDDRPLARDVQRRKRHSRQQRRRSDALHCWQRLAARRITVNADSACPVCRCRDGFSAAFPVGLQLDVPIHPSTHLQHVRLLWVSQYFEICLVHKFTVVFKKHKFFEIHF